MELNLVGVETTIKVSYSGILKQLMIDTNQK